MPIQRWLYLALAYLSLLIAAIGVVLPGLPSTEFVLLAAWAAAKSSPRLNAWLHSNPVTGKMLHNWNNGRCIARKTKLFISAMMLTMGTILWLHPIPMWIKIIASLGMLTGLVIVWRRPEPPKEEPQI
jgi:uncharacterized membrane protein YbaN (DUF454 family)